VPDNPTVTGDLDRLASAVVHRFAASSSAPRLASASRAAGVEPTLIDRLASAVGQRLAMGSNLPSITALASQVAKRLSASAGAARLASAATRHYALIDANKTASSEIHRLAATSKT
jgi:hypothetical protein